MRPGPRNLITDVAGLRVGNASDAALKSGVKPYLTATVKAPLVRTQILASLSVTAPTMGPCIKRG